MEREKEEKKSFGRVGSCPGRIFFFHSPIPQYRYDYYKALTLPRHKGHTEDLFHSHPQKDIWMTNNHDEEKKTLRSTRKKTNYLYDIYNLAIMYINAII
jgi:hypothetical protein